MLLFAVLTLLFKQQGQVDTAAFVLTDYALIAAGIAANATQRNADFGACYG